MAHGKILGVLVLIAGAFQYRQVQRLLHPPPVETLKLSDPAPPLEGILVSGKPFRLEDLEGKTVVVSFWASWCLPCRAEMPEVVSLLKEWNRRKHSTAEAVYVTVNYKEDLPQILPIAKDPLYAGVIFVQDPDGKLAESWKVQTFPTTFVLDEDRHLRGLVTGYDPGLRYRIHNALKGLHVVEFSHVQIP